MYSFPGSLGNVASFIAKMFIRLMEERCNCGRINTQLWDEQAKEQERLRYHGIVRLAYFLMTIVLVELYFHVVENW